MTEFGVLWDMDGVLVDTAEFHKNSWAKACRHYDIPFDDDFFQRTFGMNNKGTLTELLGREPSDDYVAEVGGLKERLYRQDIRGKVEPLPGVMPLLEGFFLRRHSPGNRIFGPKGKHRSDTGRTGYRKTFSGRGIGGRTARQAQSGGFPGSSPAVGP